ncbi:MAG TPA: bifunctional 1-(5-phosphoribosyl)-5-((5-phosphoribosylamino)methylideneamino)imidazole-4-carboxamide isomerase/phosphoribosylanthranilate isomerase PriA [Microlunatus sp.]
MPNASVPRPHTAQQSHLELLPAVDVAGGQAVQLVQGKAGSEKVFGDPVAAAARWAESGAEWIHLVDLDAAFGRGSNAEVIGRVITETAKISDLRFELSGGIRDDASLERALSTGCARVNIGTAALEQPQWCESVIKTYGERVAIGLDVRGETLAARGWTTEGGNVYEMLARLDAVGCARYVVTDVNSDGMLKGPNFDLLRSICARTDKPVVASGGISTLDDIAALRDLVGIGVEGAIIGTALYVGNFSLADALEVADLSETGVARATSESDTSGGER